MAPVCTPFSSLRNSSPPEQVWQEQQAAMPMVDFCIQVAIYQIQHGRFFVWENPLRSKMWSLPQVLNLSKMNNVTWDNLDMCVFGLKDPVSRNFYQKGMSLLHNLPPEIMVPVFRRCKQDHPHDRVEGYCKGYGPRSKLSQVYPCEFCRRLARIFVDFLYPKTHPSLSVTQECLLTDILDDLESHEIQELISWYDADSEENVGTGYEALSIDQVTMLPAVPVYDEKVKHLMSLVNAMPTGTYLELSHYPQHKLIPYVRHLRQHYCPLSEFGGCTVLRGHVLEV
jgi:hypothetical protein